MAGICMVEEEEEGPVIYRRRPLSVQPPLSSQSRRPVRSWIVADDDDDDGFIPIHLNSPRDFAVSNAENGALVVLIDPDALDCPICLHPLFTPVFQCENSHIACSSCCNKLKRKCPFCCTPIGINDNRCRGLEKFIQSISRISCKNVKYGCKKTMPYSEKSRHEQTCPHATCNCPHPSCSFTGSYKNLYLHFHIQHEPSTTRFTCNTTFSLGVEINQKRVFLQEQHNNVIFILNHEVKEDGRAFSIDYVGPATLKTCFIYQLTAKSMKTSLLLQSEPGIYTEWSTDTQRKNCLTVPSGFEGYSGLLSFSVCIRKSVSSEFEVETEEVDEVFGNEDNDIAIGALQVVLTDPGVLDCSICHEPLCTPVFQCQNGHLACFSCCSKARTTCHVCYSVGYVYNRCRGLEVAIESISRISCRKETMAAYNYRKSEPEQTCHPHSFREDDDELIPIADVELDSLMSEEEADEDELELMGKNQQQHMTCSLHTTYNENEALRVVLDYPDVLDCMICSNLLSPPVFLCQMGHVVCSSCCCELKGICLCCMPIGINNSHCRGFEKFIESISSISCKNAESGCKKTVPYNNKRKHEQSCPHATCFCPHPSCSFAGSFKSLYIHFGIKHTASTIRFTYDTTFSICIEIDRKHIFLLEQNENVIFILNHEVQEHGRAFNIDCVGVGCFKSGFVYQLTAKSMETCLLLRSVPEIYTTWSKDTPRKCNLTVPSGFADYDGLLSLSVCIKKKFISSEFEEEMEKVRIEYIPNLDGRLKVTLTNLDIFYCSTCFKPLCSPVIQCEKGHLSCSSCCSKMKKICPLCYTSTGCYSYNHCKALDNLIDTAIIPCKNAKRGCKMRMRLRYHSEHEQMCPHATCFCPCPSCPFTGSHENLYLHFGIKHEADITRFTYGTRFSLCVDINHEHLFLQEKHTSVIFILNHQVRQHERVIYIDGVGTEILRNKFEYQLTAKSMKRYRALERVPQIYAKWSRHNMPLKGYLTVPSKSEFAGYSGLLSLSVCITKKF